MEVERRRLFDRIDAGARGAFVIAPPGYGKSIVLRQWCARSEQPTAWLSLDRLDERRLRFWTRVVHALRSVAPAIDDEPALLLNERPDDLVFLEALVDQLERIPEPVALVLDGLPARVDAEVLDGMTILVEHAADRLGLLVAASYDPPLPLARWRLAGWVSELRARDLAFDDDEALEVAAGRGSSELDRNWVVGLNRRVEGWPLAFHLGLVSASDRPTTGTGPAAADTGPTVRHVADVLVNDVLDRMPPDLRQAALDVSVVDAIDPELAATLIGPLAATSITDLERRLLLLDRDIARDVARHDVRRFHSLVRELLEGELRWSDPARWADCHRRAAAVYEARGDLRAAHHHLSEIGDTAAAARLVVTPVLELLDAGDTAGLRRLVGTLPRQLTVDDPSLAQDLALACFLGQDRRQAARWAQLAESLTEGTPSSRRATAAVLGLLALYDGDLSGAVLEVERFETAGTPGPATASSSIVQRFPLVAARVAIECRHLDAARAWFERASVGEAPPVHRHVTVPAIEAWIALAAGRLERARELVRTACAWAAEQGLTSHHGVLEAFATAAWCELGAGEVAAANEHAGAARDIAHLQGYDWNRLRAGTVAAAVRLELDGPDGALALVDDVRASLDRPHSDAAGALTLVEARIELRRARLDEVDRLLAGLDPFPPVRIVAASAAIARGDPGVVIDLLADRGGWPTQERLAAEVLAAATMASSTRGATVRAAVEEGARTGWVIPFVGHGPVVDTMLLELPLERLHPALAPLLRRIPHRPSATPVALVEPLTPREQTIVELLPSHLSYAEIGARLYLSVNTVKSNLKTVYRKLGVTSRSEAVDAARAAGML